MPRLLARVVVALTIPAALSFAVPARSGADELSPLARTGDESAAAAAIAAVPPLRHAQAAALLSELRGALHQAREHLQTLRVLAVLASNGVLTPAQRVELDMRFQAQLFQLQLLALTSQWNGIALLDGSTGFVALQIDPAAPQLLAFLLPDCTPLALGVDWLDVTSAANAASALPACDTAIDNIRFSLDSVRSAALTLGL